MRPPPDPRVKFKTFSHWFVIAVCLAALIFILVHARLSAQTQENLTTITWVENGESKTRTFDTGLFPWLSATRNNATTTIIWAADLNSSGNSFQFMADNQQWHVNETWGDVNRDGKVDVFDAVMLLQIIVGLK